MWVRRGRAPGPVAWRAPCSATADCRSSRSTPSARSSSPGIKGSADRRAACTSSDISCWKIASLDSRNATASRRSIASARVRRSRTVRAVAVCVRSADMVDVYGALRATARTGRGMVAPTPRSSCPGIKARHGLVVGGDQLVVRGDQRRIAVHHATAPLQWRGCRSGLCSRRPKVIHQRWTRTRTAQSHRDRWCHHESSDAARIRKSGGTDVAHGDRLGLPALRPSPG